MIRSQILSDLHFEFHKDHGESFVNSLNPEGVDVLILAGDICLASQIPDAMALFCARYPHVLYVLGNHEHYHCPRAEVHKNVHQALKENANLHWLNNDAVELGGVLFVGGTMWFPRAKPHVPKWGMTDFRVIPKFEDWVYEENQLCLDQLRKLIEPGCVVVTHHLPSYRSVAHRFQRSVINPYFVCNVHQELLEGREAAFWVHGHTHDSMDYRVMGTQVVCNPLGYPHELNPRFNDSLVIELGT